MPKRESNELFAAGAYCVTATGEDDYTACMCEITGGQGVTFDPSVDRSSKTFP